MICYLVLTSPSHEGVFTVYHHVTERGLIGVGD